MTNRRTTETPQLLPLLREADQFLSGAAPGHALKHRVLAAVDAKTKKKAAQGAISWPTPVFAVLAAAAFTILCIDNGPAQNQVDAEEPKASEEPSLLVPEPTPNDQVSPALGPFDPTKRTAEDATSPAPSPISTMKSPLYGPLPPAPLKPSDFGPSPNLRLPRQSIPRSWSTPTPRPIPSTRLETPLFAPWTSPTFGPASGPDAQKITVPRGGSLTKTTESASRPQPNEIAGAPDRNPDNPPKDDDEPEVHVIGIYESESGAAAVHLGRPGPAILVLSAYAATTWTITAAPETELRSIYLLGYEKQKLAAAPEAIVVLSTFEQTGEFLGCAHEWPDKDPHSGCETGEHLAAIKEVFGLAASSFHGCYFGSSFALGEEGATGVCWGGYPFSGFPW